MKTIKQNSAYNLMVLLIDGNDHVTGKTGLTDIAVSASKNGGSFATITPQITDLGSGWYSIGLTSSNTDTAGDLALHIIAAGADPLDAEVQVINSTLDDISGMLVSILSNIPIITWNGAVQNDVTPEVGTITILTFYRLFQNVLSALLIDLGTVSRLSFALKNTEDTDDQSLIFIDQSGLTRLVGSAYSTHTDGALTVSGQAGNWVITVELAAAAAASLQPYIGQEYRAEIKAEINGVPLPSPVWSGNGVVKSGIVRVLS